MKTILHITIHALLAAATIAVAAPKATVRFIHAAPDAGATAIQWQAGKRQGAPFTPPSDRLSDPMEVPTRDFKLVAADDTRLLAEVNLPAAGNSFIALLLPQKDGAWAHHVIDAADRSFGGGDVFFCNHSPETILVELDGVQSTLKPGEARFVHPQPAAGAQQLAVRFTIRGVAGDRLLRAMSWPVRNRFRSYGIFFENPVRKRIDFRAVDEPLPDAGAAASRRR